VKMGILRPCTEQEMGGMTLCHAPALANMPCFLEAKDIVLAQTASSCCIQVLLSHCIAVVTSAISFLEI
jgi:hypothetical protein